MFRALALRRHFPYRLRSFKSRPTDKIRHMQCWSLGPMSYPLTKRALCSEMVIPSNTISNTYTFGENSPLSRNSNENTNKCSFVVSRVWLVTILFLKSSFSESFLIPVPFSIGQMKKAKSKLDKCFTSPVGWPNRS